MVLTRMFSVPDSHSVVLHSSLAKAAHCYCPFCSQILIFKNKGYALSWFESDRDMFPGLLSVKEERKALLLRPGLGL